MLEEKINRFKTRSEILYSQGEEADNLYVMIRLKKSLNTGFLLSSEYWYTLDKRKSGGGS